MSVAYLFPGQGSQSIGMGADAFATSAEARSYYEQADELLGFSLSTLCFEGDLHQLTATENQQPALLVTSLAYWCMIQADDAYPSADYVAGHSLGELSALVAVGSLSFADGVLLARKRGELMKQAGESVPGGMSAILAVDTATIEAVCAQAREETGQLVQLANDNCIGQLVIAGEISALEVAEHLAKEAGAKRVIRLPITIASHCGLMQSAADAFSAELQTIEIVAPQIPVIGNTSAQPLRTAEEIRQELTAQLTNRVRWTESIQQLVSLGVNRTIDVGPSKVLSQLVKRIDKTVVRDRYSISK